MATTLIELAVVSNDELVESGIKKPVRLTPDGYAGVAYGGAVYALLQGNVIDVSQASWEIEDCQHYLITGASIPYAPNFGIHPVESTFDPLEIQWTLEAIPQGIYLAFNSPERKVKRVIDLLETGGIQIQRWDVSYRVAADGKFYEWFARLNVSEPIEHVYAQLETLFANPAPGIAPTLKSPELTTLGQLQLRVETLAKEIAELQITLAASIHARRAAEDKLILIESEKNRLELRLSASREDSRALRKRLKKVQQPADLKGAPVSENSANLAVAEELLETALLENSGLNSRLYELEAQLLQETVAFEEIEANFDFARNRIGELEELERERRLTRGAHKGQNRGLEGYLQHAFHRLSFLDDSIDQLATLVKPSSALRILFQIDTGQVIGKDVVELSGWREISKVATGIPGREMSARIYYKPDGGKVVVSLHLKEDDKQQRRHIERLKNL